MHVFVGFAAFRALLLIILQTKTLTALFIRKAHILVDTEAMRKMHLNDEKTLNTELQVSHFWSISLKKT